MFAWCFGALGASLILRKALERWLRQRQQRKARQRALLAMKAAAEREAAAGAAAGRPGAVASHGGAGGEGDEQEGLAGLCVVCLEHNSNMVFVNCGHLCACIGCSIKLKRCPLCRTRSEAIRVFTS